MGAHSLERLNEYQLCLVIHEEKVRLGVEELRNSTHPLPCFSQMSLSKEGAEGLLLILVTPKNQLALKELVFFKTAKGKKMGSSL